jgi:hypothetical protein
MPTFSRWMPPAPPERELNRFASLVVLGLVAATALASAYFTAAGRVVLGLLIVVAILAFLSDRIRGPRMLADRAGEDIGTFARALNRRADPFDPRVIRATWEALAPYMTYQGQRIAVRPSDRIDTDLRIDWDDIDMGVLQEVAARTGRTLEGLEANPWYGQVKTVGDLVRLVTTQPTIHAR